MNKEQYIKELEKLIDNAKKDSYEDDHDKMIADFYNSEIEIMELFNNHETVGYKEELIEAAQHYQGHWKYENNSSMAPIF